MSDLIKVFLCEDEFIIRQAIKKTITGREKDMSLRARPVTVRRHFRLFPRRSRIY